MIDERQMDARSDESLTLRLERTFAAPRDEVFRAWTDPAAIAVWWWPWNPAVEIDLRQGGAFRFAAEHPAAGQMAVFGEFTVVEPPERLIYTFAWEGETEAPTTVTVEFQARGDETVVLLTHAGFSTVENRDNHGLGWSDCLDRLAAFTASETASV